jgi:hypothetical protein
MASEREAAPMTRMDPIKWDADDGIDISEVGDPWYTDETDD